MQKEEKEGEEEGRRMNKRIDTQIQKEKKKEMEAIEEKGKGLHFPGTSSTRQNNKMIKKKKKRINPIKRETKRTKQNKKYE